MSKGMADLAPLALSCEWLDEPKLRFGHNGEHEDPTVGIPLYGPWSLGTGRHKTEVHVGIFGTGAGIEKAATFYSACADGVDGDDSHAPFPGCRPDLGCRMALRMTRSPKRSPRQSWERCSRSVRREIASSLDWNFSKRSCVSSRSEITPWTTSQSSSLQSFGSAVASPTTTSAALARFTAIPAAPLRQPRWQRRCQPSF